MRGSRRTAASLISDLFTKESLERSRELNLDSRKSFATGGMGLLQVDVFVIIGRCTNELFMRGCVLVVGNTGSRNGAVETAGCR
jgi:hypothetical protein